MEKVFENKVALITGGSYGIGRATALAFAKRGAKVVIVDNVEDPEKETLTQVLAAGKEAVFFKCDISDNKQVKTLINLVVSTFGRIDFAFNNAGIEGIMGPTHECTEENFDKIIAVNLKGTWLCMKYELQHMIKQGKGVIVNNSSVAGLKGFASLPVYVASKHGVIGLTKTAAQENAQNGIRINAVCPGVIKTAMIDRITLGSPETEKQYVALEPVGRMGQSEEIAEAVVWLCSDSASFVTGIAMPVDGGLLA